MRDLQTYQPTTEQPTNQLKDGHQSSQGSHIANKVYIDMHAYNFQSSTRTNNLNKCLRIDILNVCNVYALIRDVSKSFKNKKNVRMKKQKINCLENSTFQLGNIFKTL